MYITTKDVCTSSWNNKPYVHIYILGGGNENSMVRWAVPSSLPPQMYSVGRLTRIYETHRVRVRTYVCIRLWRWLPTAIGVTCVLLYPLTPASISLAATLALPLPRAVIQSSASYDLYVVIPSVWSSGRLGFSLRAMAFVSIRLLIRVCVRERG